MIRFNDSIDWRDLSGNNWKGIERTFRATPVKCSCGCGKSLGAEDLDRDVPIYNVFNKPLRENCYYNLLEE